jgi:hypothetical protein
VISLVAGSRVVCRLGWSLALGCRPAKVFRFRWYRLAIFLYNSFSFCCRVSTSCLIALMMIVAIALLHRDGISSMLEGSVSCNIFVASEMDVVSGGGEGRSVCCWGLVCCCRWTEFLSLARRCICLVSDFVIGGRRFLGSMGGVSFVIGHIVCVYHRDDVFCVFVNV